MQVAPSDGSEINDAYEFKKQAKPTSTSDPTYGHVEHGKAARMPNCRCRWLHEQDDIKFKCSVTQTKLQFI